MRKPKGIFMGLFIVGVIVGAAGFAAFGLWQSLWGVIVAGVVLAVGGLVGNAFFGVRE
ncbi:MAG: hypothetical protein HYY00_01180 [Chloroflexi bacterium]|nr:hypothetical protein [Chloroflexota bacterium]